MEKSHQETLNRLKAKNELDINDLKTSYAKRKDFIELRSKDPFYKMENLKPKIKDKGKEYTVSLEIPEHEARFVNLTGMGKKLRLTTTRNFEGIAKTEEGGLNRSARSEMISQEYHLNSHILPRKITQVYEDGMLIFKVPKN
jgi:HSP20 family molecular chaperone IbpA